MLLTAIGIFALTALIGMMVVYSLLYRRQTSTGLLIVHNIATATGMILLTFYTVVATIRPVEGLIVLLLAALGGLGMAYRDLMGRTVPYLFALAQELTILLGFALLIYSASRILA